MDQSIQMRLKFRCPPEYDELLPRPFPAVLGLPDWYKAMPQRSFNPMAQKDEFTVKKCPPFIDAMTYGFLIPLAVDLTVQDGEFSWDFQVPDGFASEYSRSPIDFHDPSQATGSPDFDADRFIIKFVNFWTIEAPEGYSLLFTHPVNRRDLPFTTLTGLVACDAFHDTPVHFPAYWHDADFNGVLPRGTPFVQCLPVKRETWAGDFGVLSADEIARLNEMQNLLRSEKDVYRRRYRPSMR
jgi:hypothetical protein